MTVPIRCRMIWLANVAVFFIGPIHDLTILCVLNQYDVLYKVKIYQYKSTYFYHYRWLYTIHSIHWRTSNESISRNKNTAETEYKFMYCDYTGMQRKKWKNNNNKTHQWNKKIHFIYLYMYTADLKIELYSMPSNACATQKSCAKHLPLTCSPVSCRYVHLLLLKRPYHIYEMKQGNEYECWMLCCGVVWCAQHIISCSLILSLDFSYVRMRVCCELVIWKRTFWWFWLRLKNFNIKVDYYKSTFMHANLLM